MELPTVETYPSAGGRHVTRGCVFQERNTLGVATNVYLRKNVGKTEGKPVKKRILSSGVVFTLEEGISTSHVCLEGQQPLIECANMTLIFLCSLLRSYILYTLFIFFPFLWSTRVFPFAPTYSSICDEEIRPT